MTRSLLIATLSLSLGLAAATATPAAACGDVRPARAFAQAPSPEDQARAVIGAHFAALGRGDAKAVRALWDRKARIVSRDAGGKKTRTRKLARALPRWIAEREGMSWTIGAVDTRADGLLIVHATVTWNGAVYDDVMSVQLDGGGRIVGKTSTARPVKSADKPTVGY